jgi:hypothetical protein
MQAGIVRATGVSERWWQYYINKKLGAVSERSRSEVKKEGEANNSM